MLSRIKISQLIHIFIVLLLILLIISSRDIFSKLEVKDNSKSIDSLVQKTKTFCQDNIETYGGRENCYAQEFNKIAEQNGPDFSFKVLESLQKIDGSAIGCHLISHGLGAGSYKREPENWRMLVQNMPTICNYGAIHGVIESYIGSLPDKSLKREIVPTICGETPRADCNHIVGHLLLVETEANIDKALNLCTVFKETTQESFCISGVFMEYQTALNLIDHNLVPESWLNWPERVPELEKICRSYDGIYAEGCWEEIVHAALVKLNNEPKRIFDFCSTAQVPNGAKRCKRHSIGIIGATKDFDLESLKYMCSIPQKDDPTFEEECYVNLISSALSTIPSKVGEAVAFCSSLENRFKSGCFNMIGAMSFFGQVTKSQLESVCREVPSEFRDSCSGSSSPQGNNPFIIRSND